MFLQDSLESALRNRRSIRVLSRAEGIDRAFMDSLLESCLYTPSAFSMQSTRLLVLLDAAHEKFWGFVEARLRAIVPPERFAPTEEKLRGFRGGNGTVLFFIDTPTIHSMEVEYAGYRERFAAWGEQGAAMLEYALWLALHAQGLGASLQHYDPLIDADVQREWGIPESWRLVAEMPFGKPEESGTVPELLPREAVVRFGNA